MKEEKYEGPRSDHQLIVEIETQGDEVVISGHLHVQAWHPEGARLVYYSIIRDGIRLFQRVVNSKFIDGKLDEFISLSHIDLPEPGYHVYETDLFIINEQDDPVYTGAPLYNKYMRVRELCLPL